MNARALLAVGVAMPVIYVVMLGISGLLFPGYQPMVQAPSDLGGPAAPHPLVYNTGMVLTAAAGALGALGLFSGFLSLHLGWATAGLGVLTGASVLLASVGLAMAGIFPLPHPLHYGFGLTALAALSPILGALAMMRSGGEGRVIVALIAAFFLIVALVILHLGPLLAGLAMMASVALLCAALRRRLGSARASARS